MITDLGEIVFLPVEQTDEIRNDPRLSFGSAFGEVCYGYRTEVDSMLTLVS